MSCMHDKRCTIQYILKLIVTDPILTYDECPLVCVVGSLVRETDGLHRRTESHRPDVATRNNKKRKKKIQ